MATIKKRTYRGVEYTLQLLVRGELLCVEVADDLACDRWKSEFSIESIEEITQKTGSFKSFSIFVRMLETALHGTTETVSLDLLTYADLEELRARKSGSSRNIASSILSGNTGVNNTGINQGNTKRYLIMTYNSDFDRVYYPLPLVYQGKPDASTLQQVIRQLHSELEQYRSSVSLGKCIEQALPRAHYVRATSTPPTALPQKDSFSLLEEQNDTLLLENKKLRKILEKNLDSPDVVPNDATRKENAVLKQVIDNLESDLMTERTKYQRALQKKTSQCEALTAELEELRTIERGLR